MSVEAVRIVRDHSCAKGKGRDLLVELAEHYKPGDPARGCWPSVGRMARQLNITKRYVFKLLSRLEEGGHIIRERRDGRCMPVYHIPLVEEKLLSGEQEDTRKADAPAASGVQQDTRISGEQEPTPLRMNNGSPRRGERKIKDFRSVACALDQEHEQGARAKRAPGRRPTEEELAAEDIASITEYVMRTRGPAKPKLGEPTESESPPSETMVEELDEEAVLAIADLVEADPGCSRKALRARMKDSGRVRVRAGLWGRAIQEAKDRGLIEDRGSNGGHSYHPVWKEESE